MSKISPRSKKKQSFNRRRLAYEAFEPRMLLAGLDDAPAEQAAEESPLLQFLAAIENSDATSAAASTNVLILGNNSSGSSAQTQAAQYQLAEGASVLSTQRNGLNIDRTLTLDYLNNSADSADSVTIDAGSWTVFDTANNRIEIYLTDDLAVPSVVIAADGTLLTAPAAATLGSIPRYVFQGPTVGSGASFLADRREITIADSRVHLSGESASIAGNQVLRPQVEVRATVRGSLIRATEPSRIEIMGPVRIDETSKTLEVTLAAMQKNETAPVDLGVAAANLGRIPQHMLTSRSREALVALSTRANGSESVDSPNRRLVLNGLSSTVQSVALHQDAVQLIDALPSSPAYVTEMLDGREFDGPAGNSNDHAASSGDQGYFAVAANCTYELLVDQVFSAPRIELGEELEKNSEAGTNGNYVVQATVGTLSVSFLIFDRPKTKYAIRGPRIRGEDEDEHDENGEEP